MTIAHQLGLEVSTVANFFMNARRRSLEKWQDGDSKNSSMADSSSPHSSVGQSDTGFAMTTEAMAAAAAVAAAQVNGEALKVEEYVHADPTAYVGVPDDQTSLYAAAAAAAARYDPTVTVTTASQTAAQAYMQPDYSSFASRNPFFAAQPNLFPYAKTAASNFQAQYCPTEAHQSQQAHQQSSLFALRRLASASHIDPRFLATATELSASHQSLRDQALEICSSMNAAAAAAAAIDPEMFTPHGARSQLEVSTSATNSSTTPFDDNPLLAIPRDDKDDSVELEDGEDVEETEEYMEDGEEEDEEEENESLDRWAPINTL